MDSALISFFIFSIIVCLSPGPSMFFVLSQGLSGNKWSGFAAVLGLTIANMIWIILSATGITALIHSSFIAFKIIKVFGAAYLVYLGVHTWRNGLNNNFEQSRFENFFNVLFKGIVTSLSNPKALIFYLSFFPQFIKDGEPVLSQIRILGISYLIIVFIIMSFYAFLGNYAVYILRKEKIKRIFGKIIGSVFIITGLSLLKIKKVGQ